uniref:Uncharacterized protein n=1 Tax=Arundo donax TaxID=35708 RepID=A0A0A9AGW0_ARUDO
MIIHCKYSAKWFKYLPQGYLVAA